MFIECNMNPWKKCIDDCAIRAISKATGKDYFDVMDGLISVADDHDDWDIDQVRTIDTYLKSIGWEYCEPADDWRPTVKQFAKEITEPCVVIVKGHATCTKDGNTYDSWNCNRYKVKYLYRKCID